MAVKMDKLLSGLQTMLAQLASTTARSPETQAAAQNALQFAQQVSSAIYQRDLEEEQEKQEKIQEKKDLYSLFTGDTIAGALAGEGFKTSNLVSDLKTVGMTAINPAAGIASKTMDKVANFIQPNQVSGISPDYIPTSQPGAIPSGTSVNGVNIPDQPVMPQPQSPIPDLYGAQMNNILGPGQQLTSPPQTRSALQQVAPIPNNMVSQALTPVQPSGALVQAPQPTQQQPAQQQVVPAQVQQQPQVAPQGSMQSVAQNLLNTTQPTIAPVMAPTQQQQAPAPAESQQPQGFRATMADIIRGGGEQAQPQIADLSTALATMQQEQEQKKAVRRAAGKVRVPFGLSQEQAAAIRQQVLGEGEGEDKTFENTLKVMQLQLEQDKMRIEKELATEDRQVKVDLANADRALQERLATVNIMFDAISKDKEFVNDKEMFRLQKKFEIDLFNRKAELDTKLASIQEAGQNARFGAGQRAEQSRFEQDLAFRKAQATRDFMQDAAAMARGATEDAAKRQFGETQVVTAYAEAIASGNMSREAVLKAADALEPTDPKTAKQMRLGAQIAGEGTPEDAMQREIMNERKRGNSGTDYDTSGIPKINTQQVRDTIFGGGR